jgi:hypothetical protein
LNSRPTTRSGRRRIAAAATPEARQRLDRVLEIERLIQATEAAREAAMAKASYHAVSALLGAHIRLIEARNQLEAAPAKLTPKQLDVMLAERRRLRDLGQLKEG